MAAPAPPVFHIPTGRTRDADGSIMEFETMAEQVAAVKAWTDMVLRHPATVAAGACVIVGPTTTQHLTLRAQTSSQSVTPPGTYRPSACDDQQTGT